MSNSIPLQNNKTLYFIRSLLTKQYLPLCIESQVQGPPYNSTKKIISGEVTCNTPPALKTRSLAKEPSVLLEVISIDLAPDHTINVPCVFLLCSAVQPKRRAESGTSWWTCTGLGATLNNKYYTVLPSGTGLSFKSHHVPKRNTGRIYRYTDPDGEARV